MAVTIVSSGTGGMPEEVERSHGTPSQIDPDVKLMMGTYRAPDEGWLEEPLVCGIRLVLVHRGRLRSRIAGQPEQEITGSTLCAISNADDFASSQAYGVDEPLRYVSIQISSEALEANGGWLPENLRPRQGRDPQMLCCPVSRSMQAIAAQIASCPMKGYCRELYLAGKALEFAAHGAELLAGGERLAGMERLTSSDVDRIHAARGILVSAMDAPPTLEALAARVGMNARKLTAGFRRVFDNSAFGYLREYRLREAHRMLSDEELQVATVAYRVGYSPAHFAIAFRKRFGISPSELRSSL